MAHDNACPKQDTSYKTITIKVNPIPKASTKFHEFCGEQGMVYEAILDSNVKQTVLYNWSIKDSVNTLLHSSQLSIDTFRVVKLGKHFVSLEIEDGNQCKNTFTDTVNLRYSPSYLDLGKDTSITDRDSLLLKANSNFTEYLWSTGSIDSMINIIGKDIDTGNNLFWLATKDTLGCIYGDTINIFITSTVSINDWNIENLIIYPTPAKDNLQIELPTTIKNGEIKILNTEGKIVWSKLFQKNTESTLKIDISSFAKGLYIIQLKANSQVYNAKMIKE